MSKPEDIPADVWSEAGEYAARFFGTGLTALMARAILAERERCASYHDDMAAQHEGFREDAKGDLIEHHTKMVRFHQISAAAIRKRGDAHNADNRVSSEND